MNLAPVTQLAPLAPRPKPLPTFQGLRIADVRIHEDYGSSVVSRMHPLYSGGAFGRPEGYDSTANAMRAARMLSRGDRRQAMAVVDYEGRSYVQVVRIGNHPLHFEAALPARVGNGTLRADSVAQARLDGLVAIVDGSRTLRVG